ncbi:MAG: hypothetical protein K2X64_00260 [Rhodocyclaceae bacterium]|nr:hypothetical protein [Rhodocyclaceae bacterium]
MKLPHFLLLCACVSASSLVLAQGNGRAMRDERESRVPHQRDFRPDFERERERVERRERYEQREQMSIEERRQLRRDVNDAGREIYRRPPPERF